MVVFISKGGAMSDFRRKAISLAIGVLMAAGAAGVAMAAPPGGTPPGQIGKPVKDPPPPPNTTTVKHSWGQDRLANAKPALTAIQATTHNPSVVGSTSHH